MGRKEKSEMDEGGKKVKEDGETNAITEKEGERDTSAVREEVGALAGDGDRQPEGEKGVSNAAETLQGTSTEVEMMKEQKEEVKQRAEDEVKKEMADEVTEGNEDRARQWENEATQIKVEG